MLAISTNNFNIGNIFGHYCIIKSKSRKLSHPFEDKGQKVFIFQFLVAIFLFEDFGTEGRLYEILQLQFVYQLQYDMMLKQINLCQL